MVTEIAAEVRANKGVIISRNERRIGKSMRRIRYVSKTLLNTYELNTNAGRGRRLGMP